MKKKVLLAAGATIISVVLSFGVRKTLQMAAAKREEQCTEEESY